MKTQAVRLHGEMDVRFGEFELPEIKEDEVLLHVICDTVCMSTYKAVKQGSKHKRVPNDIEKNPIILGHEMCCEIAQVGGALKDKWQVGQKVVIHPALKLANGFDPGYSYTYIGGNSRYAVVPNFVLERGCMLPFNSDGYFSGSLVESLGCDLRGYKAMYHTDSETYERRGGIKKGGKVAILAGAGPMGIGAVELAIGYYGVKQIVVSDINGERLNEAAQRCSVEKAKARGTELIYLDTSKLSDATAELIKISDGGFDDVVIMAPVPALFTMAGDICREDGCINMFAGPVAHDLAAPINIYRIHYDGIHIVGTTGSIPEDAKDVIRLIEDGSVNTGALISHIVGLKALPQTIFDMVNHSGAKKVCYNDIDIPLIAIKDLDELGKTNPLYKKLGEIVREHGGVWCAEAERYLLKNAPKL